MIHVVETTGKNNSYTMVIRFHTAEGEEHIVDFPGSAYAKGQSFELIYNQLNVKEIAMADPAEISRFTPYLLFFFGAMGIAIGIGIIMN